MYTWSFHFIIWYSILFALYIGYIHVLWWLLGIIHIFPNFIRLTSESQKTLFSRLLTFKPKQSPNYLKFWGNEFFHGTRLRSEGDATGEPQGPNGHGPRGQMPGPRGAYLFPLVASMLSIFVLLDASWPKTIYKKGPPCGLRKRAPPKHRNTKQKPGRSKIGGENSGGALPVWSPSLPMTLPSSPWWRGSSPPLDYGFVAVANYISLLLFIVLAPYKLHNIIMAIFISLLWWIFLWVIYEIVIVL
jgi:hypothetical protein